MGELVPGMAYLVRRLLENTSNESLVRHRFAEGRAVGELVAPPPTTSLPGPRPIGWHRLPTDPEAPEPYAPEPVAEWRRAPVRAEMEMALRAASPGPGGSPPIDVPAIIGGRPLSGSATMLSVDPARPSVIRTIRGAGYLFSPDGAEPS